MPRTFLPLAFASLFVATAAYPDSFYFPSSGGGNVVWGNVYVNPYTAFDNTLSPTTPLTIFCDDWNTDFYAPATWSATVSSLTTALSTPATLAGLKYGNTPQSYTEGFTGSDLTLTALSNPSSAKVADLYLEAAYLDSQYYLVTNPQEQEELAAAEWSLFVNASNVGGLVGLINNSGQPFASAVYNDLVDAQNNYAGFDSTGWYVITPDSPDTVPGDTTPMQEFLFHSGAFPNNTQPDTAPEPAAIILLATVIGVLSIRFRRKTES